MTHICYLPDTVLDIILFNVDTNHICILEIEKIIYIKIRFYGYYLLNQIFWYNLFINISLKQR